MYHKPLRSGVVAKSLRPSLEMVERRRRELEQPGAAWWPAANIYRAAAACVLGAFCVSAAIGLAMTANASIVSTADAAYAATVPFSDRQSARSGRAKSIVARRAKRRSIGQRARALHIVPRRETVLARTDPAPTQSTPTALPTEIPTAIPTAPTMLSVQPWALTADGTWTTVATLALPNGQDSKKFSVTFSSDEADVLPLDSNSPLAPGAILTVGAASHAITIAATSTDPAVGRQTLDVPAPSGDPSTFAAVAQAVGPQLVDVGWTPLDASAGVVQYKIYRRAAGAHRGALVGTVSPNGRSWHDDSVAPSTSFKYTVIGSLEKGSVSASTTFVATPSAMPATSVDAISGKGMFLYFTPNAADSNGYAKYDAGAVIERAQSARITHIEVRMARGTFIEAANAGARAWLDALIDKAAAAGIKLIAWQVPRRSSSADAATAVAAARYQTSAGNGFAGLSLDIEDGENYTGFGDVAKERMVDQIEIVRRAVGPDYLIVATVMSPALTHWTNARYPFARIAPFASVLQPMEYWHHFYSSSHHTYTQDEVAAACADSVSLTRQLAGRSDIPINVAGQSDDLGTTGPPSPDEVGWCLAASRNAGAIGQTFFDWRGTNDDNWSAIAGFAW